MVARTTEEGAGLGPPPTKQFMPRLCNPLLWVVKIAKRSALDSLKIVRAHTRLATAAASIRVRDGRTSYKSIVYK